MSRVKAALLLLVCLALSSACAESPSLITEDLIRADKANYETVCAETGTFIKTSTSSAVEYYPYVYNLRCEFSDAKFGEYLVRRGDEVKAGDVLASFTLDVDEVELASLRLSAERAAENLAEEIARREESLILMREALTGLSDPNEQELASLRILRAELALEQYIYQQELSIARTNERIAEIESDMNDSYLYAPVDGIIDSLTYIRSGDRVYEGTVMVELYRTDGMLLRIDNSSGNFRYGMQVNVEVGPNNNRSVLTGKVVGADTLVPSNIRLGYAFVQLDPYDESIRLTRPSVKGQTFYIDNVITLPRTSVTLESGNYYVSMLGEDGTVLTRIVSFHMNNNTDTWIIQGIKPGDTIIVD